MTAKPRPLVQFLDARFEYIRCMHKGDADDLPEKLKSESLAGILKQIALSKSISIQDGIALAKLIDGGPMPADASGAILSAIQNKVDLCSADAQQTHGRQIH